MGCSIHLAQNKILSSVVFSFFSFLTILDSEQSLKALHKILTALDNGVWFLQPFIMVWNANYQRIVMNSTRRTSQAGATEIRVRTQLGHINRCTLGLSNETSDSTTVQSRGVPNMHAEIYRKRECV